MDNFIRKIMNGQSEELARLNIYDGYIYQAQTPAGIIVFSGQGKRQIDSLSASYVKCCSNINIKSLVCESCGETVGRLHRGVIVAVTSGFEGKQRLTLVEDEGLLTAFEEWYKAEDALEAIYYAHETLRFLQHFALNARGKKYCLKPPTLVEDLLAYK